MMNPDGTAICDRCGLLLPGFGVLLGMIAVDLTAEAATRSRIFCYANDCRSAMLAGMVRYPGDPTVCTHCGRPTPRAVASAVLTFDLDPVDNLQEWRGMGFCYDNGSAALLWANIGGTG